MINHTAIIRVKAVAETPELGHGDTEARPKPEPIASRIRDVAAIAKAPPRIGGQAIPEVDASTVCTASAVSFYASAYRGAYHSRSSFLPSISARAERAK